MMWVWFEPGPQDGEHITDPLSYGGRPKNQFYYLKSSVLDELHPYTQITSNVLFKR